MNFPELAIRYRPIVFCFVSLFILWGIYTFATMPRREDPEFEIRTCTVTTAWPGATSIKVEQLVTDPLESAIDELDEVEKVHSITRPGFSIIYVDLEETIPKADPIWDKVRAKVDLVRSQLPAEADDPIVNDDFGDTSALVLALYQYPPEISKEKIGTVGRRYTPRELDDISDRLKDRIKLVDSVARVDRFGVQQEAIYLEVTPEQWANLQVSPDQLQPAISGRNIVLPGGVIETPEVRYIIRPSGEFQAVERLNRVSISSGESGRPVYLKDLDFSVERRYAEPPSSTARFSDPEMPAGVEAVVLSIQMKSGFRINDLGEQVQAVIERAQESVLPRDIGVAIVSDQPKIVHEKISSFTSNLMQSILIVFIVALLLIGWRIAVAMAISIPIIMLGSIAVSRLFGVQLETFSIASLIIALGMLVDNAIEVCDNTLRLLEEGYSRRRAAIEGASQIAFPILIATLTTVAAFIPMLIALEGGKREYLYSLPVVVSTTLLISYSLAMTFTVMMAYSLLTNQHSEPPIQWISHKIRGLFKASKKKTAKEETETSEERDEEGTLSRLYGGVAMWCLRHKYFTLLTAVILFGLAIGLVATGIIPTQFFPESDRDQFVIEINLPEGSSFYATDKIAKQVERLVHENAVGMFEKKEVNRLNNMITYIGEGGPRFYGSLDPEAPTPNYALILVNTTHPDYVTDFVEAMRDATYQGIAGARVVVHKLDNGPPVESPIALRVSGEKFADINILRKYATETEKVLQETPGTWNVHDSWGSYGYQIEVEIDEDRAILAGVTNEVIAQALNSAFSGARITTFRDEDHLIPIYLRLPQKSQATLETLNTVYIHTPTGKIPLESIANFRMTRPPSRIDRYQLARMIQVEARVEPGIVANSLLMKEIWPEVQAIQARMPPGYRIEIGGEQEETVEAQQQMQLSFLISLLLIISLLVIQYNSFIKPFVILTTIPFAIPGAFFGLLILNQPLGFMAQVGLLSLAGIVLNAAIVLIEFIEIKIHDFQNAGRGLATEGEPNYSGLNLQAFREAVVEAGKLRITPIMLTTLTTIGGLLPLALSGGPLFEPLASVVIFGLAFCTFLTLLVIPAMVMIFVELFNIDFVKEPTTTDE
ncbi:Multicomponent efflux pump (Cytoplasmic membrane subunit, RND type ABC transporters) [Planctomycetales bacterium 10988]|nr:Multicomponent efflux pump (Cytoplasmic membrane subunit, RND type ABC transporters) [Planctomycetales bacterium 10988]